MRPRQTKLEILLIILANSLLDIDEVLRILAQPLHQDSLFNVTADLIFFFLRPLTLLIFPSQFNAVSYMTLLELAVLL